MTSKRHPRSKTAFTVIEVLLAAVVMLAGIVGMMQAVTSGSEMLDVSRKQTIATQIMHGEIEKIRVLDWTQITALPATETVDLSSDLSASSFSASASFRSITKGFQCSRSISPVVRSDGVTKADQKQVTYTVSWTGNTGRSYLRRSSTYVGKNGLYVAFQR
jgi:Tfp pilus assembly protein PilV